VAGIEGTRDVPRMARPRDPGLRRSREVLGALPSGG